MAVRVLDDLTGKLSVLWSDLFIVDGAFLAYEPVGVAQAREVQALVTVLGGQGSGAGQVEGTLGENDSWKGERGI